MIALLCGMLLTGTMQPPGDAISQEVQRLGGTWQVTSSQSDGADLTARVKGYRYVFDGQLMKLQGRSGKPIPRTDGKPDERSFLINVQTNPKTIDMTIQVKGKAYLSLGIYRLLEDELTICLSEPGTPRPTEFKSRQGVTLIVLQRLKK